MSPRTARMTGALRGRGNALVLAGAAAALVGAGAGTASAATTTPAPAHQPPAPTALTAAAPAGPAALNAAASQGQVTLAPATTTTPGTGTGAGTAHAVTARTTTTGAQSAAAPAAATLHTATTPAQPYEIYDSVTPAQIPAGNEIATYADGGYAVSPSAVHGDHVLWIDTNGSDPRATALDVEPGDATPAGAAAWVKAKLTATPGATAIVYTMRSDWAAAKAAVNSLPDHMGNHVQWWIADPTGTPHIVPGAAATQWYWGSNYDITSATPGFWTSR
jgi:hypothetical protein